MPVIWKVLVCLHPILHCVCRYCCPSSLSSYCTEFVLHTLHLTYYFRTQITVSHTTRIIAVLPKQVKKRLILKYYCSCQTRGGPRCHSTFCKEQCLVVCASPDMSLRLWNWRVIISGADNLIKRYRIAFPGAVPQTHAEKCINLS